jgi:hypothetical protein
MGDCRYGFAGTTCSTFTGAIPAHFDGPDAPYIYRGT